MKIQVTTPPTIYAAPWLRRYATALIVVALVALATLGAGVAQMLYTNGEPRMSAPSARVTADVVLDQHERHSTSFIH
ncbi:MAG TPA: hypothetical protein VKE41_24935 [Roseiflexaceae bacterium]|nr:hypothetical protein [Roseiflexaceae bacterium]